MLYIFGGLPGTGKSTLAIALARTRCAFYLRVDTIEQSIRNATAAKIGPEGIGPEGYEVAYSLASENLQLGAAVVADSVNSLEITRQSWRDVATEANSPFVEIEIVCSDMDEHRRRIVERQSTIKGLTLPTWQQVERREYFPWNSNPVVIDTAGETAEQSIEKMKNILANTTQNHEDE